MSGNTFGTLFAVTNFGESHGPAIGCVIDGCPPGMTLSEADIQGDLDRRRPGTSRHVTQRNEPDAVEILSGVYEGKTTGTPICLLIKNTDQRSKDYGNILETFRPAMLITPICTNTACVTRVAVAARRPGSRHPWWPLVLWPKSGCLKNTAPRLPAT